MNPVAEKNASSLLRIVITALGVWGASRGVVTTDDWINFLIAGGSALASFLWARRSNQQAQQKLLVSLARPELNTEAKVETAIAAGVTASLTTPKTLTPVTVPAEKKD